MIKQLALPTLFVDEAAALVRRRTGLVIGESRREAFATALVEAMCSAGVHDPVVYLADLAATPALMDELAGRCTVGETYFLRDPEQLALITDGILPALAAKGSSAGPLRMWSAGCATGEEPYSLAILASRLGLSGRTRILGTDLSRAALARARRARYGRWSLRGVPEDVVAAHFQVVGDQFELRRALREAVEFRYLNLADETYPSSAAGIWAMDLILCRNVLIYFDGETIARVAARLVASLAPDGWLVLGPSDPAIGDFVSCQVVVTRAGLAYRRAAAPSAAAPSARAVMEPPKLPAPEPERIEFSAPPHREGPEPPAPREQVAGAPETATRLLVERDYDRAVELARRAIARDGNDPVVWAVLVRALAARGDLAGAERACVAALERHSTVAELQCLHALLLNEARQYEAAAAAARRALYLGRALAVAHLAHGAALAGLHDRYGARHAFATARRLLGHVDADSVVPASGGERAGRLAELAQAELELLAEAPV